jgi:tetratricopeptide (TPR) repeat protein
MVTKIDKKELMEPDKLQIIFLNIREFIEKYRSRIYVGTGIFLLIIFFSGGLYLYSLHSESSAVKIYNRVLEASVKTGSPTGDATALQGYKDLIAKYPQSNAAITAHYRLGNLYFSRLEFDSAIGAYQDYIKKANPYNDLITLAYIGLGASHEAKKDFNRALESYEMAIKTSTASSFEALNYSNIARVYEALSNPSKAAEFYKKAQGKTTDPLMTIYLKRKIAILG